MTSLKTFFVKQIGYLGLTLTILPALMVYAGMIEKETYYWSMVVGMLLWFSTAIFWIKPDSLE
jgi:hypothetical protein